MKRKIKLSIAITIGSFALALFCQTSVYALAPAPSPTPAIVRVKAAPKQTLSPGASKDANRKSAPDLSSIKSNLPDLYVYFIYPPYEWGYPDYRIRVAIRNVGNEGFESSNVKGPISVWLRVWRPVKGKPLTDEPAENTFIWAGVLTIPDGLKVGEMKEVLFLMAKPPGGWPPITNGVNEPLYMRWNATVDPKNVIKETNEKNNTLIR